MAVRKRFLLVHQCHLARKIRDRREVTDEDDEIQADGGSSKKGEKTFKDKNLQEHTQKNVEIENGLKQRRRRGQDSKAERGEIALNEDVEIYVF